MGDHVLKIPYEPRDYVYARYQQSALPHEDDCCAWLAAARLTTSYLPFEFLAHFYAACASVAAKYEESKPKADVIAASTGSSTKEPHGHSLDPTNLGGTENIIAESNNLKALANKLSKRPSYSQPMLGAKLANHVRLYQMNLLEDVSIGGRLMSPYAKAWFAISRVRGSAGQMLNHALCKSLDDTVAWICNYIVWSEMDSTDNDAGTIPRAVADLRAFATSLHVLELGTNSAITFIIQALECIEERRVHFCAQKHRSKRSDDLETAITGSPVSVVGLERTAMLDSSCCSRSSHSTRGQESLDVVASNIGDLVTFSCGHNGWPQVNELDQVTAWLSSKTLMLTK